VGQPQQRKHQRNLKPLQKGTEHCCRGRGSLLCDGAVKGIVCLLLCLPCVFVYVSADGVALVVMFVGRSNGRSRGADRASLKLKWAAVVEEAKEVLALIDNEDNDVPPNKKPDQQRVESILDAAAALPVPEQIPGGRID